MKYFPDEYKQIFDKIPKVLPQGVSCNESEGKDEYMLILANDMLKTVVHLSKLEFIDDNVEVSVQYCEAKYDCRIFISALDGNSAVDEVIALVKIIFSDKMSIYKYESRFGWSAPKYAYCLPEPFGAESDVKKRYLLWKNPVKLH